MKAQVIVGPNRLCAVTTIKITGQEFYLKRPCKLCNFLEVLSTNRFLAEKGNKSQRELCKLFELSLHV